MECIVYMGKTDVERQHINVEKMKMLGATVIPVTSGNMTLKDATNEAIRDWCCHPADTYYIIVVPDNQIHTSCRKPGNHYLLQM